MEATSKNIALSYQFLTTLYKDNIKSMQAVPTPKNFGELSVLGMLDQHGGTMSSGDLTKELVLTTPRTAALLKTLEKKSLVKRVHSAEDKRIILVSLTEGGKTEVKKTITKIIENVACLYEKLGEEEMNQFLTTLKKISAISKECDLCLD